MIKINKYFVLSVSLSTKFSTIDEFSDWSTTSKRLL